MQRVQHKLRPCPIHRTETDYPKEAEPSRWQALLHTKVLLPKQHVQDLCYRSSPVKNQVSVSKQSISELSIQWALATAVLQLKRLSVFTHDDMREGCKTSPHHKVAMKKSKGTLVQLLPSTKTATKYTSAFLD